MNTQITSIDVSKRHHAWIQLQLLQEVAPIY